MHNQIECTKIFVGNVPFQCTKNEFYEIFKDVPGFVNAELVYENYLDNTSRGFGFVTVSSKDYAMNLISKNNIILKDRVLRFTDYNFKKSRKNYLFVKNIPKFFSISQIQEIFKDYGELGACLINTNTKTGKSKGSAIIEIKDSMMFQKLINMKKLKYCNNILIITKWKNVNKEIKNIINKELNNNFSALHN